MVTYAQPDLFAPDLPSIDPAPWPCPNTGRDHDRPPCGLHAPLDHVLWQTEHYALAVYACRCGWGSQTTWDLAAGTCQGWPPPPDSLRGHPGETDRKSVV